MTTKQKVIGVVAAVAVVFGAGLLVGRRSVGGPTVRDVVTHQETTQQKTNVQADSHADRQDAGTQVISHPEVVVKKRTTTETKPDGTKIVTRDEERDSTAASVTTTEASRAVTDAHQTTQAVITVTVHDQVVHEVRVPTPLPRYLLGVSGGVSVPGLFGGDAGRQLLPFLPRVAHGILTLDVRVAGPVYVGVWADTAGAAGVSGRVGWGR